MELKVEDVQVPEKIGFNYEELKTQLTTRCEEYKKIAYTPDTIKEAKADRAMLNKLKDSLNTERLRRQREYMRPFETFKAQVDDLIGIINEASSAIDHQVKDYEEQEAEKKRAAIIEKFESVRALNDDLAFVQPDDIWDRKWLNKTKTLAQIEKDITAKLAGISGDIGLIQTNFKGSPDAASAESAAMANYKKTFDVRSALRAGADLLDELAARREEEDRQKQSAIVDAAVSAQEPQTEPVQEETVNSPAVPETSPESAQEASQEASRERRQRVVLEITASEHQFPALNSLIMGAKSAGAQVRIVSKEEL